MKYSANTGVVPASEGEESKKKPIPRAAIENTILKFQKA